MNHSDKKPPSGTWSNFNAPKASASDIRRSSGELRSQVIHDRKVYSGGATQQQKKK